VVHPVTRNNQQPIYEFLRQIIDLIFLISIKPIRLPILYVYILYAYVVYLLKLYQ